MLNAQITYILLISEGNKIFFALLLCQIFEVITSNQKKKVKRHLKLSSIRALLISHPFTDVADQKKHHMWSISDKSAIISI